MRHINLSSVDALDIVVAVLATVTFLVAFLYLRRTLLFWGYARLANDLREIRKLLRGKIIRNGNDLLVGGSYRGLPASIRLSRSENAPELTIQLRVHTRGNLFVAPLRSSLRIGEYHVPVPHALLASRCSVRTDYASEARSLLQHPHVVEDLWDLCCSSQAFLSMGDGVIHFTEGQLPATGGALAISRYLHSLTKLAVAGAGRPVTSKGTPGRNWHATPIAAAAAVLVFAAIGFAMSVKSNNRKQPETTPTVVTNTGIPAADARKLFGVGAWRLAKDSDFDRQAVRWLEEKGLEPTGTICGAFGPDGQQGVAYVLVEPQTRAKRVVLLVGGAVKFDKTFPRLALAAKLANVATAGAQWEQETKVTGAGDGILLVPDFNESGSATVISNSGLQMASATPKNFRSLHLQ